MASDALSGDNRAHGGSSLRNLLRLLIVFVLVIGSITCGGESPATTVSSTAPALSSPAQATAAATATRIAPALSDLALVYLDASRGQGSELYTAASDGAAPKKVATLGNGSKVLDLRGHNLAAASQSAIAFIDLTTGASKPYMASNFVVSGRFVSDSTFIFTTSGGCAAGGRVQSSVYKLDIATLQQSELITSPSNNVSITALDPATGTLAVTPLGCDVGVRSIGLYSLADGKQLQSIEAAGCGWSAVAIGLKKALVSWRFCTQPAERAGVDATLYDYAGSTVVAHDLKAPGGGSTLRPWLLRPGQAQVALATAQSGTPGPNFGTRSTGLWLLDLNTLAFSNLTAGEASEQWPVAWSEDGRYLLVATVQAQGVCSYTYIDVTSKETKTVSKDITFCGANGDVFGWTSLR
jgi:hypothetical protein